MRVGHSGVGQPAGQLGDRDAVLDVAAEQLGHDRRLVRHDLVAGVGVLGLAHVAVAERGAGQHVHRAWLARWVLPRRVRSMICARSYSAIMPWNCTSSASSGRVRARALDEHHGRAGLGELLDQQRLVGVLAGQPVRGVDQHARRPGSAPTRSRSRSSAGRDQAGAGVPVVAEHPLLGHIKPQLLGVRAQRRGLRADRLLLLLPGRGHPGVDRCVLLISGTRFLGATLRAGAVWGPGCGRRPTVPRPHGGRRRTRSRPPGRSPSRMVSAGPRQELLQRLGDHRGQRPPATPLACARTRAPTAPAA